MSARFWHQIKFARTRPSALLANIFGMHRDVGCWILPSTKINF
jgi:hypothetical protein